LTTKCAVVKTNGFVVPLDPATSTVKTLSNARVSGATTYYDETGVQYQIPVGKIFCALSFNVVVEGTGTANFELWNSGSANSATGIQIMQDRIVQNDLDYSNQPIYYEIPAGNYLNINTSNTEADKITTVITGVEVDV
jgi:hypothetical protein|tara:strand:+ start:459 stop:872 length:414 start_codon:yes stop_codon:yes gene_type:complete